MNTLHCTLNSGQIIRIIPHVEVLQDGHPILVHHYDLFKGSESTRLIDDETISINKDKWANPDYLGELIIEDPEKLFVYHHEDQEQLSTADMQEVIAYVMAIRTHRSASEDPEQNQGFKS